MRWPGSGDWRDALAKSETVQTRMFVSSIVSPEPHHPYSTPPTTLTKLLWRWLKTLILR